MHYQTPKFMFPADLKCETPADVVTKRPGGNSMSRIQYLFACSKDKNPLMNKTHTASLSLSLHGIHVTHTTSKEKKRTLASLF